ncbi:Heterokaryon incompatibility protein (HET) domain containing protein [Naviculisporaceae sp. PSN 640]
MDDIYAYKPLEPGDSIRLLALHPGHRDDPITCTLSHTHIEARPYRALSYEWGDENDLGGIITVNGMPFPRRIQNNLESALREIRTSDEDVVLWIDALCINQDDISEKGHQVAMMGKVFRGADSVIAWLGPESDNSEMAMDLISDKITLLKRTEQGQLKDAEHEALIPIACRSYWSRVWIVQEFFLAKSLEIRCGTKAVSYDEFENYIEVLSLADKQFRKTYWGRRISSAPAYAHISARLIQPAPDTDYKPFNNHLLMWLRRSYDCKSQASNPRDYIYALVGVSDDCVRGELVPDYTDNEETLRDALLKAIPICMKSLHRLHRKDRLSWACFFIKYAQKLGITLDAELQSHVARLMYVNTEDLKLEKGPVSQFFASFYTKKL